MRKLLLSSVVMACLTTVVGCGGPSLGTVPVTGKVLLDGSPCAGANIVFNPNSAGGRAAAGVTDDQGVFNLTTEISGDGALPGDYKISVTKYEGGMGPETPDTTGMSQEEAMDAIYSSLDKTGRDAPPAKNLIGPMYANFNGSGLTASVSESGPNDFTFEVKSK